MLFVGLFCDWIVCFYIDWILINGIFCVDILCYSYVYYFVVLLSLCYLFNVFIFVCCRIWNVFVIDIFE